MKRRDFLKNVAGFSSATIMFPFSSRATINQNNNQKTGYAILGLGFFASYVMSKLPDCEKSKVTALITSDRSKAKDWIKKYNLINCSIYTYSELDKIQTDQSIDAVYIATPVGTHAEFAIKCFNYGKHVITEKTMASSVKQAEAMIEAAKKAGKKLMVAYRARYEPYNNKAIEFCREETFGKVTSIVANKGFFIGDRLGKNNWRIDPKLSGGGALVDIGIYSIQACRYLAGQEPTEVMAISHQSSGDSRFEEVEENLGFVLKFPDGLQASGMAGWNYDLQNYYKVGAERATFELNPATSNGNLKMFITENRKTREHVLENIDQISAEFDHFSDCIQHDLEPLTNGEEGLKDLRVVEALYESARTGKLVRL